VRHPHILTQTFSQQPVDASQPAIDEALLDITLYRNFAVVTHIERFPYRVTTLRFRHLLEEPKLAEVLAHEGNDRKRARDILYQIKHGITI
jgi:IS5 family transposase